MNFELTFERDGTTQVSVHKTAKEAFAKLDFEMDYNIFTPGITAVVRQADRIVRAIVGGKVYEGQPRGKIEVKPMPKERYDTHTLFYGGAPCDWKQLTFNSKFGIIYESMLGIVMVWIIQ